MLQKCLFQPQVLQKLRHQLEIWHGKSLGDILTVSKYRDSRLSRILLLCYQYALKCCKNAFFEPSCRKNCGMEKLQGVLRPLTKFQWSRLSEVWFHDVNMLKNVAKMLFSSIAATKNRCVDLKFGMDNLQEVL